VQFLNIKPQEKRPRNRLRLLLMDRVGKDLIALCTDSLEEMVNNKGRWYGQNSKKLFMLD